MSSIVYPTSSALRERVFRMRFALILMAAAALPGALRSVDDAFGGRAPEVPAARWQAPAPVGVRIVTPAAPRFVVSPRPLAALAGRAAQAERVVERWSVRIPVTVEVTCPYPASPTAKTRCRSTHQAQGTKSRSPSAPIATPRAPAGGGLQSPAR